jgi:shikimate kinase
MGARVRLALIGFMGAGKTTVGRRVAAALGVPFLDADEALVAREGRSIPQLFAEEGEAGFRARERSMLEELFALAEGVVALGGGAIEHEELGSLAVGWEVAYLAVPLDVALARVGGDAGRPILARPDLAEVYARRAARYAALATVQLEASGPPEETVRALVAHLSDPRRCDG